MFITMGLVISGFFSIHFTTISNYAEEYCSLYWGICCIAVCYIGV